MFNLYFRYYGYPLLCVQILAAFAFVPEHSPAIWIVAATAVFNTLVSVYEGTKSQNFMSTMIYRLTTLIVAESAVFMLYSGRYLDMAADIVVGVVLVMLERELVGLLHAED